MTSPPEGVIHAFAVPAFGIKIDAVPGKLNETWFNARKEGIYYGQCSELCGVDHSNMPIEIQVVSQGEFDAWVKEKVAPPAPAVVPAVAASAAAVVSVDVPAPGKAVPPPASEAPAPAPAPAAETKPAEPVAPPVAESRPAPQPAVQAVAIETKPEPAAAEPVPVEAKPEVVETSAPAPVAEVPVAEAPRAAPPPVQQSLIPDPEPVNPYLRTQPAQFGVRHVVHQLQRRAAAAGVLLGNGDIKIADSEVGKGTTFRIVLKA